MASLSHENRPSGGSLPFRWGMEGGQSPGAAQGQAGLVLSPAQHPQAPTHWREETPRASAESSGSLALPPGLWLPGDLPTQTGRGSFRQEQGDSSK